MYSVGECRVNAYIVFKMEDSAQASLSHNMAVVSCYIESLMHVLTIYCGIMICVNLGNTQE